MNRKIVLNVILSFVVAALLFSSTSAQNLTVRDIMAEPSLSGMRVTGEKLSPDGTKVVFLWNADGKLPRDLYLVSTSGGPATVILRTSDLPAPTRRPERENKLDYGLVLRDDFARSRENQLGNFEWSPNSKKLVFSHSGDIYILTLGETASAEQKEARWATLESAIRRASALLQQIIGELERAQLNTEDLTLLRKLRKDLEVSMQSGGKWDSQRAITLQIDRKLQSAADRLLSSPPAELRSNESFMNKVYEWTGAENRIAVARSEYEGLVQARSIRRLTKTQGGEGGARFLDNDRILFTQSGNIFVWNIKDSMLTQISREANPQAFVSVFNATPNKEVTMIAYVVSDSSKYRALVVPNYLDAFVAAGNTRRGWSEQKVMVMPADGSRDSATEIKLPKQEGVGGFRRIAWAADGRSLIIDRGDKDTKRRQLFYVHNAGGKGEQIVLVTEETDPKWQAPLSTIIEPHPKDPNQLFFASEKDGYNHLYLAILERTAGQPPPEIPGGGAAEAATRAVTSVPLKGPNMRQLTKGNWQVEWAKWADDSQITYSSTQDGTAERQLYILQVETSQLVPLQKSPGMKTGIEMSESAAQPVLVYEGSTWNQPGELFSQKICTGCTSAIPVKLTNTTPDRFKAMKWNEPKFLHIPSRDGKKISAKIYLPTGFNAKSKQKYTMVIFVHGAGYLQNVINGWNNYYREFMFNQLLTQMGYVVLDIDYRGSAGYGRDWRTDVYDFLGGKDYEDHLNSIDFMVANYAVNPAKVGVYGGSYGGFMAGMLAMRAPEKIAAAAALRPVFDWKNYYASSPGYTAQRLGFPDKNPEAYKRSSPISYADQLRRPLLILHGMSDDNVHVQDSVQLIEKLIRLGKTQYFEAMLYPSENHAFVRPESWADEYERILAFFERHLK